MLFKNYNIVLKLLLYLFSSAQTWLLYLACFSERAPKKKALTWNNTLIVIGWEIVESSRIDLTIFRIIHDERMHIIHLFPCADYIICVILPVYIQRLTLKDFPLLKKKRYIGNGLYSRYMYVFPCSMLINYSHSTQFISSTWSIYILLIIYLW